MTIIIVTLLLYSAVGYGFYLAHCRRDGSVARALQAAGANARLVLPRVVIAVLSAGFIAAALPKERVIALIGPDAGLLGALLTTLAGAITPGGPMVIFAIAISLLKAGAGLTATVAYITAWSLFNISRTLLWEAPSFGWRFVLQRWLLCLLLPSLAGGLAGGF